MNAKIVLVDDVKDDVVLLQFLLHQGGFRPHQLLIAHGPEEAMAILQSPTAEIAVAFIDITVPALDGVALLQWIRTEARCAHIKVIVLGPRVPRQRERARQLGADAYLVKFPLPASAAGLLHRFQ